MKTSLPINESELRFHRRLRQNLVHSEIVAYFAQLAAQEGLTKNDLAIRLNKDASLITRWFQEPANMNLDTVSDLLTAMHGEMDFIVRAAGAAQNTEGVMAAFDKAATHADQFCEVVRTTDPKRGPASTDVSISKLREDSVAASA